MLEAMDGLGRALGSGATFKMDGKTYQVSAFDLGIRGAIEQQILSQRKDPIRLVAGALRESTDELSPEHEKFLLELAYKDLKRQNKVTQEESMAFLGSLEGLTFVIWHMVKPNHPEVTYETVEAYANNNPADFLLRATSIVDQLGGTDHLGKLIGRMRDSTDPAIRKAAESFLGENLSETSLAPTKDGPSTTSSA